MVYNPNTKHLMNNVTRIFTLVILCVLRKKNGRFVRIAAKIPR